EEHQPERDAVDAQLEVDAERVDPGQVEDLLEAALRRVELLPDEERHQEGDDGGGEADAARHALLLARGGEQRERAERRQPEDDGEEQAGRHQCSPLPSVNQRMAATPISMTAK